MRYLWTLMVLSLLVMISLCTGCTSSSPQQGSYGTVVTQTSVAAPETPGPTQTLPHNYEVSVEVHSDGHAHAPHVIFTFQGGYGMNVIPEIDVRLTRSDGIVENDKMVSPLTIGQSISLDSTNTNTDRAEVWVITPSGDRVKVVDKYVPFRSYS